MSLLDDAIADAKDIIEGAEGVTLPILFTSPPEPDLLWPPNTEFGTLDPDDEENIIRGWPGDHYTQYDPDTGIPQAGLNVKLTITLKTLLDKGIITTVEKPNLNHWKISWLDPTSAERRDFMVDRIHPTRSLGHIVFILGEIKLPE